MSVTQNRHSSSCRGSGTDQVDVISLKGNFSGHTKVEDRWLSQKCHKRERVIGFHNQQSKLYNINREYGFPDTIGNRLTSCKSKLIGSMKEHTCTYLFGTVRPKLAFPNEAEVGCVRVTFPFCSVSPFKLGEVRANFKRVDSTDTKSKCVSNERDSGN